MRIVVVDPRNLTGHWSQEVHACTSNRTYDHCPPSQRRRRDARLSRGCIGRRIFRPFMREATQAAPSPRGAEQSHDDAMGGHPSETIDTTMGGAGFGGLRLSGTI